MRKKDVIRWSSPIVATAALVVAIAATTFLVARFGLPSEEQHDLQQLYYAFMIATFVPLALYSVWMLHFVRKDTSRKQQRIDMLNYIYEVEKLLFNAHENRNKVTEALERIAWITTAENVGFWIVEDGKPTASFLWGRMHRDNEEIDDAERERLAQADRDNISLLLRHFDQGNDDFITRGRDDMARMAPQANRRGVTNLVAIPTRDADGEVRGVLVACNLRSERHIDATPLRSVGLSFAMFCRNLQTYDAIKEQGERDVLTGLYNRNRFEADLPQHPKDRRLSIACLYIDVNGLHELNNRHGHDAGDDMLRTVAGQIADRFGTQRAYRIGGDEFVAFVLDENEADTQRHIDEMKRALADEGIDVSVGMAHWSGTAAIAIDQLLKAAERKMYEQKRAYYQQEGNDRRHRDE